MERRQSEEDLPALLAHLERLGATPDEVRRASAVLGLGPLALDLAMRPPGASESLADLAARSGVGEGEVRRLWSSLGLPLDPPFPFPVTPDMATAIQVLLVLVTTLGEEPVHDFGRVLGAAAARLADALAETSRVGVELPQLASGTTYAEVVEGSVEQARELLPTLVEVIGAVFRRHLVLVSYQRWSPDEARAAVTLERTVCFADLVGSTALLRGATPKALASLVRSFERQVWEVVTAAGGRVVKLIGDEAMFVVDEPAIAVGVVRQLLAHSPHPLRIGLDHGEVVTLGGDVYGATVVLAARLVRLAAPGTAVASDAVCRAVPDAVFEPVDVAVRDFPDERAHRLRTGHTVGLAGGRVAP